MARCTAPVEGHRSASAAANCPACRNRYGGSSYDRYDLRPSTSPFTSTTPTISHSVSSGGSTSRSSVRPRWTPTGSSLVYTPTQVQALTPIRENAEKRLANSEVVDLFLCHAWNDRKEAAKTLHDLLTDLGVTVWFSEKNVSLGSNLLREIDKGLAKSRIGLVLVTPALIDRLKSESIADKELSALLARELLVPVVHNTTYEKLREVSPLLASRSGLNTVDDTMETIAAKLAELVAP